MKGILLVLRLFNYPLVFDRGSVIIGLTLAGLGFALVAVLSLLERRHLALKAGLIFVMLSSYVYMLSVFRILMFRVARLITLYLINPSRAGVSLYHTLLFMNHYPELWVVVAGIAGSLYFLSKKNASNGLVAPQWLLGMAEELALRMGVNRPRLFLIENEVPFIRTNGDPDDPVIEVSVGALNLFDHDELKAAIAHELGHIKNADRHVLSLALGATMSSALSIFSVLIGLIIRRDQEYLADDEAVKAVGAKPLIKALYKAALVTSPSRGLGFIGGVFYPSPYTRANRLYKIYITVRVKEDKGQEVQDNTDTLGELWRLKSLPL